MNLSLLSSPFYLGYIYLLVFPLGYLLLDFPVFKKFHLVPFPVRFPIYLAFGLLSSTVLYYVIGFIVVDGLFPIVIFALALLLLLLKRGDKLRKFSPSQFKLFSVKKLKFFLPIVLFLCCLAYFSYVVGSLKWPTPSDAINHGQFTSQIIDSSNIFSVTYPSGFHVTAANLSLSLNLYPGEAILILAAAIMILIPSVLYSLTYIHTKSLVFSVLAFISTFLVNTSRELQHWLLSSFFTGRYAAIYGYLTVFTFCVFISLERMSRKKLNIRAFLPLLLISISLFITYPPYVIFVGLFFLYWGIVNIRVLVTYLITLNVKMKLLLLVLLSSFCLVLTHIIFQSNLIERVLKFMVTPSKNWGVQVTYFSDWRFGFIIILGIVIAIFQIIKKQSLNFNVFFLILCLPVLLSLNDALFPHLIFLLPTRTILIVSYLSWVLFPILLNLFIFKRPTEKRNAYLMLGQKKGHKIQLQYVTGFIVSLFLISQLAPTVFPHLSFMQASDQNADWFVNQKGFSSDFEALEWIHWNIPSQDLILNDLSHSSFYLRLFSIKNIGIIYHNIFRNDSDILDFIEIWKNPSDMSYLKRIIETYEMKYIFVTSESRFFDFIKSKTDIVVYTHKFYTPAEYIAIFNTYSFLTPIFRKGQSVIYRISS